MALDNERRLKKTVTVEIWSQYGGHDYTVRDGETYCDRLAWDEMLGTVAELTHPRIGQARYRMLTREEWEAEEARRVARNKELENDEFEYKP